MRRRFLTGGTAVFAAAAVLLSGCGASAEQNAGDREAAAVPAADLPADDFEGWNALLEENTISADFQRSLSEFAFESSSTVLSAEEENAVFSPLSLYYALAVLGSGASGETGQEILDTLGAEDREALADQCGKLFRNYVYTEERQRVMGETYEGEAPDSAVRLANSLWISEELSLDPSYQELCGEEFYASSYSVDFADGTAGERMGQWIAKQTKGVLEPRPALDPETMLAILNTLFFYGGWQDAFSENMTEEEVFTREDSSEVEVPFMNRTESMANYIRGDGYTMAGLSTNHNCRMLFVLPEEGVELQSLLEDPETLKNIFADQEQEWKSGEIIWKVPKFSFGSSLDLKQPLETLGIQSMFDSTSADFSDISEDPLAVDQVIQEAHIGVDEEGVEGAAYTMIALSGSAAEDEEPETIQMFLNRPFLFAIYDSGRDVWLFLGVCRDPSVES